LNRSTLNKNAINIFDIRKKNMHMLSSITSEDNPL